MRALLLLFVFGLLAPPASAWTWAPSPAGHLAFITDGTLRVASPDGVIAPAQTVDDASVAIGSRGDVLLAWFDREQRLWARYGAPGGQVGAPELVARRTEEMEALPMALDDSGHALIAWARRDGLHVRERDPVTGWQPAQTIPVHSVWRAKLALAGNGRAVLAWSQGARKRRIAVSRRAPGGRFGPARVMAGVQRNAESQVVAVNARGDYAVAWVELHHGDQLSVHVRVNGGAPVTMRDTDASGPAVDVEPDGRTLVTWRSHGNRRYEAWDNGARHVLTRHGEINGTPTILPGALIVWLDAGGVIRASDLRVTQAIGRGSVPAFAAGPQGLSLVEKPPQHPGDPITWRRVPLPLQGE